MASPAAVLSMLVQVHGVTDAKRDLGNLDDTGKRTSATLGKVAKVAAVGLAGGIAAGAVAVKGFIQAASESEKSGARMQTQLKAVGISYGTHAKHIDTVIAKQSALAGLDDEELQDSFTNLVRTTKDVNEALRLNGIAADIARAKGISLEAASKLVQKAHMGQSGALRRVGIEADMVTTAQRKVKDQLDEYRASHKKLSPEMQRHFDQLKEQAKAEDQIASGTANVTKLQQAFSGQAKAYGDTAAGAQEKFKVAVENLQEALGERLLPIVAAVAGAVADFVNGMQTGEGAGGRFIEIIKSLTDWLVKHRDILIPVGIAIGVIATAVGVWTAAQAALNVVLAANPIGLVILAITALVAGIIYAYRESETFRKIVDGAFKAIKAVATPVVAWLAKAIPDAWDTIKAATIQMWNWFGPFLRVAFEGVKNAVTTYFTVYKTIISGVWDAIRTITRGAWDAFETLVVDPVKSAVRTVRSVLGEDGLTGWLRDHSATIKKVADALAKPFVAAFNTMKSSVEGVVTFLGKVVGAVKEVVDWIGKIKVPKIDIPFFGGGGDKSGGPGGGGPFSNVQQIANASLSWGLSGGRGPGQGYRPGDDGWHGQNRARDLSGSPAAMMGFAQMLYSTMGGRLLELIYSPMGTGIKNGRPLNIMSGFGRDVYNDHFDHVHVAMANGGHVKQGGWAVVGERGPELAHLPSGASVYSNQQSRGMLGGGMVLNAVIDLGAGIQQRVRIAFDEQGRQVRGAYLAGGLPS